MASAAEQLAANMNIGSFAKATELHKRLLFTLGALLVYRIGTYVPIPGINGEAFLAFFQNPDGQRGILDMFNMFSGGAVERMAVFALNVMPYISASIIVQLMGAVYPPWEKLKKEGGESGRKQLNQYTRYLTVFLALAQSFGIAVGLNAQPGLIDQPGLFFIISTVTVLTGGTMFLMWLGEQVTARGVGNGISLIIFAGIVAVLPSTVARMLGLAQQGQMSAFTLFFIAIMAVAVIVFIVFMERAQRRLLIQYPKRQEGNRMTGGERSFLPLKVNTAGVIPAIFASSLLMLPTTVAQFTANANLPEWMSWLPLVTAQLTHGKPVFMVLYAALIIFFCFFYTSITFNPEDTAENLRKYGGFLPGIRPGKRTAEYLDYVLTRLTVIGAGYITAVCLLPEFMISSLGNAVYFGGTSILIVVSVTMDTVAQIQSHLLAHQYEGLIKKAKLRGRGRGGSAPARR
ncbi:preprotein translocase subunit SecY [Brevundimonas diminuta]|uniref:Protein translocase subunit SecY n=1 Tax=Brevundimonas naejangsanensis TaxID=588932 RepID=A0A172Y5V3_9CAUL|nr:MULTISPECIES: preprotein translocase subunit SecY [Brevundimonas]ANF54590.1 preprotein translocase subunit SecY [Brevundimonas naejangsanensis]MCO8029179.1 preprotein translocase subunit SecY [Brevundimonas diminuta]QBQ47685.1 preprotein translocase subunit SecY [Brevundimonas naejangsanensis]